MIDFTEIGTTVEKPYRPYLWIGEEHDAHVVDFNHNQDWKFGNVGAIKEHLSLDAGYRLRMMQLASIQPPSLMLLQEQAFTNQLAMMHTKTRPSFWNGMMQGMFPFIR